MLPRLEAYERNKNFGVQDAEEDIVYRLELPPMEAYKDLNTGAMVSFEKIAKISKKIHF